MAEKIVKTTAKKKAVLRFVFPRRPGTAGRIPLPGASLANHTYNGFGSKCFVPVPEGEEEDSVISSFFGSEEEEKEPSEEKE